MDETASSSFSPPPPQPPGGARARRNALRYIKDTFREAANPPVQIRDRSRSRNQEPIIEEPKREKEKHVVRNL